MRPRKDIKKYSCMIPPSAGHSTDDDDDFIDPSFNSSKSTLKRKKLGAKQSKKNKENDPKEKDTQKRQIYGQTNILPAIEAQRQRRGHCVNYSSCHIVHYLRNITQGSQPLFWQDQSLNSPVMASIRRLGIHRTFLGFTRRATALAWHPTNPSIAAVGSKGGDIIVWNYEKEVSRPGISIEGTGANGSIQALKFNAVRSNFMYSASINGQLSCHDVTRTRHVNVFLDTNHCEHWYTSLDVSTGGDVVVAGDNRGYVSLLTASGETLWKERLHKQKVTHIEFCPRMPWCLVTTSVDRSLKVWDVRNMKSCDTCLHSHYHERPVNSAHFSRTDGSRLVTTDQHSEIRVYSCPSFTQCLTIPHPHRQFQHLTPIKATWHPLRDIIVVGHYPDPKFTSEHPQHVGFGNNKARTIDFFDGATGQLLNQLSDPACSNKIVSLNLFGHSGDTLLSAAGMCVWIWKPKFKQDNKWRGDLDIDDSSDNDDGNDTNLKKSKRQTPQKRHKSRRIMKIDRYNRSKI